MSSPINQFTQFYSQLRIVAFIMNSSNVSFVPCKLQFHLSQGPNLHVLKKWYACHTPSFVFARFLCKYLKEVSVLLKRCVPNKQVRMASSTTKRKQPERREWRGGQPLSSSFLCWADASQEHVQPQTQPALKGGGPHSTQNLQPPLAEIHNQTIL